MVEEQQRRELPGPPRAPKFADIKEAISAQAAATLVSEFGGEKLYIPKAAGGSALASSIGLEDAAKACAIAGGLELWIPAGSEAERRALVIDLRRSGYSMLQIAVAVGLSYRSVQRILSPSE